MKNIVQVCNRAGSTTRFMVYLQREFGFPSFAMVHLSDLEFISSQHDDLISIDLLMLRK